MSKGYVTGSIQSVFLAVPLACGLDALGASAITYSQITCRAQSAQASGINNARQVAGSYIAGSQTHAFVLSSGHYTITNFPGASSTTGSGI